MKCIYFMTLLETNTLCAKNMHNVPVLISGYNFGLKVFIIVNIEESIK